MFHELDYYQDFQANFAADCESLRGWSAEKGHMIYWLDNIDYDLIPIQILGKYPFPPYCKLTRMLKQRKIGGVPCFTFHLRIATLMTTPQNDIKTKKTRGEDWLGDAEKGKENLTTVENPDTLERNVKSYTVTAQGRGSNVEVLRNPMLIWPRL